MAADADAAGAGATRLETRLAAGTYTGAQTCVGQVANSNANGSGTPTSGTVMIMIGPTGLPIENGREVAVGDVGNFSIGEFSASSLVTDVEQSGDEVIVRYDATITVGLGGFSFQIQGTREEVYARLDASRMRFERTSQFESAGAMIPSLNLQCGGELTLNNP